MYELVGVGEDGRYLIAKVVELMAKDFAKRFREP